MQTTRLGITLGAVLVVAACHGEWSEEPAGGGVGMAVKHPPSDLSIINDLSMSVPGPDLASGGGSGGVSFQSARFFATSCANDVEVADLNGDAKPDVALSGGSGATACVLLGDGLGGLGAAANYPAASAPPAGSPGVTNNAEVAIADYDGDHHVDLAVGFAGGVSLLLGRGDGTFGAPSTLPSVGRGSGLTLTTDFNGDLIPDLAIGDSIAVEIWLGAGNGTFNWAGNAGGYATTALWAMALGDFNGDSRRDLVTASATLGTRAVVEALGAGDGTFSNGGQSTFSNDFTMWAPLAAGDFNGDGRTDFAVAVTDALQNPALAVFLGPLSGPTLFASPGNVSAVAAGDINGDGRLDLVTPTAALLGNGDGTFQPYVTWNASGAGVIAVADLNGDGRADVVETTSGGVDVFLSSSN
jgi:hypothetical protein